MLFFMLFNSGYITYLLKNPVDDSDCSADFLNWSFRTLQTNFPAPTSRRMRTVKDIIMINDSTIKVDMNIDEKRITHIKNDDIATIGSAGLVGNLILYFVAGNGHLDIIRNGDNIESYSKIGAYHILSSFCVSFEIDAATTSD